MSPMGTEVRALAGILSGFKKDEGEEKGGRERNLVTLNLLGGGPIGVGSGELDLDFRVSPPGLGNRCDLLSDKMQPQKPSPSPACRELQDLNLPPAPEAAGGGGNAPPLEDSASLDHLHIVTSFDPGYPGICTLENVKSALVRAKRESRDKVRQEGRMDGSPSSSSSSATNSSMKRRGVEEGGGSEEGAVDGSDSSGGSLMAAGCPNCLLYVLVAKRDPRCPRCGSHVPAPAFYKKPRVHF